MEFVCNHYVNKNAVMAKLMDVDLTHSIKGQLSSCWMGQSDIYLSSVLYKVTVCDSNLMVTISVAPDGECQSLTATLLTEYMREFKKEWVRSREKI